MHGADTAENWRYRGSRMFAVSSGCVHVFKPKRRSSAPGISLAEQHGHNLNLTASIGLLSPLMLAARMVGVAGISLLKSAGWAFPQTVTGEPALQAQLSRRLERLDQIGGRLTRKQPGS